MNVTQMRLFFEGFYHPFGNVRLFALRDVRGEMAGRVMAGRGDGVHKREAEKEQKHESAK